MTSTRPNIIFLFVDSLRYDRLGVSGYRPALTPTLDRLASSGINCTNHFSVGCPTQIAAPGMFTSTLPLDHGGYTHGIKNRPRSFVEDLQNGGYETFGASTVSVLSYLYGYDRGFSEFHELVDMIVWMQVNHSSILNELMTRWEDGTLNDAQALAMFQQWYPPMLDQAHRFLNTLDSLKAPEHWGSRAKWRQRLESERKLYDRDPLAILHRKMKIGSMDYFVLGEAAVSASAMRRAERVRKWDTKLNKYIFLRGRRRHYQGYSINKLAESFLKSKADGPFFMMLHYFEVHEAKLLFPALSARRALDLPGDMTRALRGRQNHEPVGVIHDIGIANVDRQIHRLLGILRRSSNLDNSILVITADHGMETQFPKRGVHSDLSRVFFDDHLRVPLIISGPGIKPEKVDALMSHLDLGPTILELAGLEAQPAFSGRPLSAVRDKPSDYVIFENTGRGWCDIQNKPIFIGLRSLTVKVVYRADAFEPVERDVFDLIADPHETRNLADTEKCRPERDRLGAIARQRLERLRAENAVAV